MEEIGERKFGQRLGAEEGKWTGRCNLQLGIGATGILTRLFLKQFGNLLITLTQSLGRPGNQVEENVPILCIVCTRSAQPPKVSVTGYLDAVEICMPFFFRPQVAFFAASLSAFLRALFRIASCMPRFQRTSQIPVNPVKVPIAHPGRAWLQKGALE